MTMIERPTALMIIDMQDPTVAFSATSTEAELRRAAGVASRIAEIGGIRVLAPVAPFGPGSPVAIGELAGATVLPRSTVNALDDDAVAAALAGTGAQVLLIGGIASEAAVLHTALAAINAGLAVEILVDLCGGFSARTEEAAFQRIARQGGSVGSLVSYATSLVRSTSDPRSARVLMETRALIGPTGS